MRRASLSPALLLIASVPLLALPAGSPAQTAGKKPFAISHLYDIRDVSDPRCSPDGSRVAFVVREDDFRSGSSNSDIYVCTLDGKRTMRMTSDRASDSSPRWSPDGSQLLFVSTRSGSAQAWILPANGGEPRQVTAFESGVSDLAWFPDGKSFLFTSRVYPECGADNDCNTRVSSEAAVRPAQGKPR